MYVIVAWNGRISASSYDPTAAAIIKRRESLTDKYLAAMYPIYNANPIHTIYLH